MTTRTFLPPQFQVSKSNPCGLDGIEFVEFVSPEPEKLEALFKGFGLSKTMRHASKPVDLYQQGDIAFLVNREPKSFAAQFGRLHGPSICSMGWRVKDAKQALTEATARGAKARPETDFLRDGKPLPAIFGIGDSLIYFVDRYETAPWESMGFVKLDTPEVVPTKGFSVIDHLTNNVEKGTMQTWASFYKSVFGFEEVRYFDIRGAKTGLTSYALRSPCGRFCIPINEADEKKSQINEYIEEYHGPGIQHLAFLTDDILGSLKKLEGTPVEMLDMDAEYYQDVFQRFPQVTEDKADIQRRNVLVDGDEKGYLLQIFTKNLIGPIFIEIIQRKNHFSFGEGNFGALFRSIERDQQKRGVFD
ncbi:MAG: 4-hydroxyphenylpyruvate dioxygenase [Myxococcaceae bacterium]|nr:4-hydroxyphenylpyruvate dioxygenase [Myxococcaceae bacterium]